VNEGITVDRRLEASYSEKTGTSFKISPPVVGERLKSGLSIDDMLKEGSLPRKTVPTSKVQRKTKFHPAPQRQNREAGLRMVFLIRRPGETTRIHAAGEGVREHIRIGPGFDSTNNAGSAPGYRV